MNEPCGSDGDRLLASAARFLIDGQEEDAANVLLSCALDVWESGGTWYQGDETLYAVHVVLTGRRAPTTFSTTGTTRSPRLCGALWMWYCQRIRASSPSP
jgi:hypothetical protein